MTSCDDHALSFGSWKLVVLPFVDHRHFNSPVHGMRGLGAHGGVIAISPEGPSAILPAAGKLVACLFAGWL
jgi:hypothetical protein